jgi:hypothetical protein
VAFRHVDPGDGFEHAVLGEAAIALGDQRQVRRFLLEV